MTCIAATRENGNTVRSQALQASCILEWVLKNVVMYIDVKLINHILPTFCEMSLLGYDLLIL